jgi:histidyl-tRNA synthetase
MIKAVKGTKDVLPEEASRWRHLEKISRALFGLYGYEEMRTPVIEETALFVKTIGKDTDIVKKEMFSFEDRGGRDISLRPEGTAPIVRAYLENNLNHLNRFQKLYYIGPMFRAERPQAGRLRQFNQIGIEAIGATNPALDAEIITLLVKLVDAMGITDYRLRLNNLGCKDDKRGLSKTIRDELSSKAAVLCEDCKRRVKTNPLRVLDCKNENCRTAVRAITKEAEFLCGDCAKHFEEVLRYLDLLKVPYTLDRHIVRGLDYYTRTVFEVTHPSLGSQDAIGAGGRYDNLISDMGGPQLGACGFALGVERLLMTLKPTEGEGDRSAGVKVFIAALGSEACKKAFLLADELRSGGVSCDMDYEARSLKAQMRAADKAGAKLVLIIGEDEMKKGEAVLRDMRIKEQMSVRFDEIPQAVRTKI